MTKVPLLDLKMQYKSIKAEIDRAIGRVLDSQQFIMGPEVEALETEIAPYCGAGFAVGLSSGTDALLVSLMALGVSAGDEVITTPFTFFSTVGSILRLGAVPVFADIEPSTFNIDASQVQKLVTERTRAVIPVHLFGQCSDMEPLLQISQEKGIPLIEDAAQAIGAEYQGKRAGSMGTVGCFSFFPSKNLGAFGDGGLIATNDCELADRIRIIRNQGGNPKHHYRLLGGNFRLDAIQAAVLRVKLQYLDSWSAQRRRNADFYTARLHELGLAEEVAPPQVVRERHVFNQYVVRAKDRDRLAAHLNEKGIGTEVYYPIPAHLQDCLNDGRYRQGVFPVCEAVCNEVLALPIYPELTEEQKEYVVTTIAQFYGK